MNKIFLVGLALCASSVSGCSRTNTTYASGFDRASFEAIQAGFCEAEVKKRLGEPVEIYSQVQYSNGSINNIPGAAGDRSTPDSRILNVAFRYSKPKNPKVDYRVFEIVFSDAIVVQKYTYTTD